MSAPGPESIPTSADKRSHRPLKKRKVPTTIKNHGDLIALQAANVDSLFANPDQEIKLPPPVDNSSSATITKRLPPPPEIVTNVQGSSAGAGSGEFHVYKAARRREYERLRLMDEEVAKEKAEEEFRRHKEEREAKDEEKTRKNREKREKKRLRAMETAKKAKELKKLEEEQKKTASEEADGAMDTSTRGENGRDGVAAKENGDANGVQSGVDVDDKKKTTADEVSKSVSATTAAEQKLTAPAAAAQALTMTTTTTKAQAAPAPAANGPGLLIIEDDDD